MPELDDVWSFPDHQTLARDIAQRIEALQVLISRLPEHEVRELQELGVSGLVVDLPPGIRKIAVRSGTTILSLEMWKIRAKFVDEAHLAQFGDRVLDLLGQRNCEVEVDKLGIWLV
jgi:hypothetical protein